MLDQILSAASQQLPLPTTPYAKRRVLVVDEATAPAAMLSRFLASLDTEVRVARGATEALVLLRQESFDAVVLEPDLYGQDIKEVLQFARARFPQVPIAISTTLEVDEALVNRLGEPADRFISKRAGSTRLVELVQRLLKLSPATA